MDGTLRDCEQEVERARAKLAQDLATIRAPETFSSFTDDLKHEALDTKDALIDKARSAAQDAVGGFIEELKAKAAANPAAALVIGAGIAWRLIRNPPIATALVGAGLFSLWRTQAPPTRNGAKPDYLQQGKQRLKEQVSELASEAQEVVADAGQAARDKVRQWTDDGIAKARTAGTSVASKASGLASDAADTADNLSQKVSGAGSRGLDKANNMLDATVEAGSQAWNEPSSRDQILLGVAGVAVAAALGLAAQRRISETAEG